MSETFLPKQHLQPAAALPAGTGPTADWKTAIDRFWRRRVIEPLDFMLRPVRRHSIHKGRVLE